MTLPQIALAFLVLCTLATASAFLDWPSLVTAADDLAVKLAGLLAPVWKPIERALF